MILQACRDKPHRCPTCGTIPERINSVHGHARWWAIYRCHHGHRWTPLPIPGRHAVCECLACWGCL